MVTVVDVQRKDEGGQFGKQRNQISSYFNNPGQSQ